MKPRTEAWNPRGKFSQKLTWNCAIIWQIKVNFSVEHLLNKGKYQLTDGLDDELVSNRSSSEFPPGGLGNPRHPWKTNNVLSERWPKNESSGHKPASWKTRKRCEDFCGIQKLLGEKRKRLQKMFCGWEYFVVTKKNDERVTSRCGARILGIRN